MAGLLDIPRELYLSICTYLEQPELLGLSAVSRFAYIATQSPLYQNVRVSTYPGLIKLTRTLNERPVVTFHTPRSHHDSDPCERTIVSLDVGNQPYNLNPQNSFNFYNLAQLITAIARRCPRVEITLRITNRDVEPIIGLPYIILPRVCRVIVFAHPWSWQMDGTDYWTYFLGGHVFPDLHCLETNGFPHIPKAKPLAIEHQMMLALEASGERANAPSVAGEIMCKRLEYLRSLKIEGDVTLDAPHLYSLLRSTQVPIHLTALEIVNCPIVFFGANITTLKTLLRRSLTELPELRKLKLHLVEDMSHLGQDPQDHLCDVVRTLGQNIPHLDLAFPFACANIFAPQGALPPLIRDPHNALGPPTIDREPRETLPQRLIDQGFKYRRLICWFNMCFGSHDWEPMTAGASSQGAEYSWEVVYDEAGIASWYLGDHAAVHYSAAEVVGQPY